MSMKGRCACTITWRGGVYHVKADVKDYGILLSGRRYELNGEKTRFVHSHRHRDCPTAESSATAPTTGTRDTRASSDDSDRSSISLSIRCEHCRDVAIVGCDVASDITLGLRYPCVVLRSRHLNQTTSSSETSWFTVYVMQLRDGCFVVAGKMTSSSLNDSGISWKSFGDDQSLIVTDGPGFCYSEDRRLYAAVCTDRQQQKIQTGKVEFSDDAEVKHKGHEQQNTMITVLATVLLSKNEIVLLTLSSCRSPSDQTPKRVERHDGDAHKKRQLAVVRVTFPENSSTCGTKVCFLDATDFIPQLYSTIVTKVLLYKFHTRTLAMLHGFRDTGQTFDNTLFIFTRQKQLLTFSNGRLISCTDVDVSGDILKMMTFSGPTEELYVLILDEEHNVYVVATSSFKVQKTFGGVHDVFVDDVLHEGSDQLLMIQEEGSSLAPSAWHRFTITNLYTSHLCSAQPQGETAECSEYRDDKLQVAITALQGRLQAGLTHLARVQRELDQKKTLVEQVSESIKQMSLGSDGTVNPQPGLHPLLGSSTGSDPLGGGDCGNIRVEGVSSVGTTDSVVTVTSVWQRVVERDHWVVATNVTNDSQQCLRNMSAFITLHSRVEQLESFCQFHRTNAFGTLSEVQQHSSPSGHEPRPKKAKSLVGLLGPGSPARPPSRDLPAGGSGMLLVVTKIPDFRESSKVTATVVLVWTKDGQSLQGGTMEGHVLSSGGDSRTRGRNVCELAAGTVTLHAADVITEKFKVKTNIQQGQHSGMYLMTSRLALNATQLCTVVNLHSTYTDLSHLEDCAMKELGFHWSQCYECYLGASEGQLAQIRLQLYPVKQKGSRLLKVFSRDEAQFFLFVHAVYSIVADDVILLPYCPTDLSSLVTSTLHAIQEEVATGVTSLKALLQPPAQPGDHVLPNDQPNAQTAMGTFVSRKRQLQEESTKDEVIAEDLDTYGRVRSQLESVTDTRLKRLASDIFIKKKL